MMEAPRKQSVNYSLADEIDPEIEPRWHWRNCRSIGFIFHFWLWPWAFGAHRDDDVYGGQMLAYVGPFVFGVAYSIGNASSYNPIEARFALCEIEAEDRAIRWEQDQ